MKKLFVILLLFYAILSGAQVKIACIGNSITYGAGMVNREKNAYPAQLQAMLGEEYQVMNFGVNGTTLLRKGNRPYWNTEQYQQALQSKPDLVFIKLGTNDSKQVNRPFYAEFEKDYTDLINSFRELESHPRVVLLLPVPSFLEDSVSIYDPVIRGKIIPMIQQVAYTNHCELINLYPLFSGKSNLFPDKIHPSSLGATVIARHMYEVVKQAECNFDLFIKINKPKTISSFYGYECADFVFENRKCKVVKPRRPSPGLPWIWRARFWGHEPQTDIALLERGFHLVYCDVAELFGNKQAVKIWNKFYNFLHQAGLSKKVVLEGMSRGGVYVYNWALANPTKVACIYADAPVLDLKSWPGGKGIGPGSPQDWEIFKTDYKINNEEQALKFKGSPLDKAAKIARLKIPLLHVVGDADEVVPVDENTNPFEKIIKANGGDITVIHKPGIKHHPHSLPDPTPIVDFILRATNRKTNFAVIPCPASEYRSAAGWKEGCDWWCNNEEISVIVAEKQPQVLLIGNSITQGFGGNRSMVTYKPGKQILDKSLGDISWESAGISGDRTQHILWRIINGNYENAGSKVVILTLGVNNFPDDSPVEVVEGIELCVNMLKQKMPQAKIVFFGPLPAGLTSDAPFRLKYEQVHNLLSKIKWDGPVIYRKIDEFILPDGNLDMLLMAKDGVHLASGGYTMWSEIIAEMVKPLLDRGE